MLKEGSVCDVAELAKVRCVGACVDERRSSVLSRSPRSLFHSGVMTSLDWRTIASRAHEAEVHHELVVEGALRKLLEASTQTVGCLERMAST